MDGKHHPQMVPAGSPPVLHCIYRFLVDLAGPRNGGSISPAELGDIAIVILSQKWGQLMPMSQILES